MTTGNFNEFGEKSSLSTSLKVVPNARSKSRTNVTPRGTKTTLEIDTPRGDATPVATSIQFTNPTPKCVDSTISITAADFELSLKHKLVSNTSSFDADVQTQVSNNSAKTLQRSDSATSEELGVLSRSGSGASVDEVIHSQKSNASEESVLPVSTANTTMELDLCSQSEPPSSQIAIQSQKSNFSEASAIPISTANTTMELDLLSSFEQESEKADSQSELPDQDEQQESENPLEEFLDESLEFSGVVMSTPNKSNKFKIDNLSPGIINLIVTNNKIKVSEVSPFGKESSHIKFETPDKDNNLPEVNSPRRSSRKLKQDKAKQAKESSDIKTPIVRQKVETPRRSTRQKATDSPLIKKMTSVTPMRRAAAQKTLLNTITNGKTQSMPSSPMSHKRKSSAELKSFEKKSKLEKKLLVLNEVNSIDQSVEKAEKVVEKNDDADEDIHQNLNDSFQDIHKGIDISDLDISFNAGVVINHSSDDKLLEISSLLKDTTKDSSNDSPNDSFLLPESPKKEYEDDLMDQSILSVMDTSIVHDTLKIESLNDFLLQLSISFKISDQKPLPQTLDKEHEPSTDFEKLLYGMHNLKQDLYRVGCEELDMTLEELKTAVVGFVDDIEANPPLIFQDYQEGTEEERDIIKVSFSIRSC